jgi:alpha-tubulin suppressor-like RCC1 family protein
MSTIRTPGNVYDPDNDTNCSPGGPFYITNIVATPQPNGTTSISFAIQGGTNGVFYDIFATPALNNSLADYQWTWIGQGLTCNAYTFTNQPPGQAFYALELPALTWTLAFDGQNTYGQLDVPEGLSNAVAIAAGGYFSLALRNNGTVIGWGDNTYGETTIPAGLTNVVGIAAGYFHGVALLANGSVTNWGYYWDGTNYYSSVTNRTYASAPPTSGVVAVAAGGGQDLALMSNGTCVAWGFTNVYGTGAAFGTKVPTNLNLTNVSAIACGWQFNLALSSNGTVTAWGYDDPLFGYPTNVPADLTSNAVAIAAGAGNAVALRKNGTVEAWGDPYSGVTNVPAGLSNVVAVATGGEAGLALLGGGTVVAWGESSLTNILPGVVGVKAISAGFDHNLIIESGMLDPVIFTQPTDQYAPAGGSVTFSAQGEGVAGVQYQWQFNGVNITGATNATLTLTNVRARNNGNYDVVVSTDFGSITSSVATFTLVVAPGIGSTTPQAPGPIWMNYGPPLSVVAITAGQSEYPLNYGWQFNGTNIPGATNSSYTIPSLPVTYDGFDLTPTNEGIYTVVITNAAGSTNISWNMLVALPGMVEAWGDDTYGECNRPATLTNATAIAAGEYQSVAVTDAGTVAQWGYYSNGTNLYSVTNTNFVSLPPTSGVVAVAAGLGQALALLTNGTVKNWGVNGAFGNSVPANLTNVQAIACGWQFDVALSNNGTVTAWSANNPGLNPAVTNVPGNLSNVIAIAAGAMHTLALQANGNIAAWGYATNEETTVPTNCLSNVVAIAAGRFHSLALLTNGQVVAWGAGTSNNPADGYDFGQSMVPAAASNGVMAIAAGDYHSVALLNNGAVVAWGDNCSGQTNVPAQVPTNVITSDPYTSPPSFQTNFYPPIVVKLIAAGANHTMAAIFSPLVQYPVDVSKDLLLIYNTNSLDSWNVCQYYLTHRPMVSNANVLGIGVTTNDPITPTNFTTNFQPQVQMWLSNNPTKRPLYVILFQNVPQEVDIITNTEDTQWGGNDAPSVQCQLHNSTAPGWYPFVTAINMNGLSGTNFNSSDGTNDCIAYINKLTNMANGNPPRTLFISASAASYTNSNWYFDFTGDPPSVYSIYATNAQFGVTNVTPTATVIGTTGTNLYGVPNYTSQATNVAGYFTDGWDFGLGDGNMFVDGTVRFFGDSGWYIMTTIDSFNGQRVTFQAGYLTWFATNAFGGTNYSNTPVGAVTTVNEPGTGGKPNAAVYYGDWAAGKSFAISAWAAQAYSPSPVFQAVGDPFIRK